MSVRVSSGGVVIRTAAFGAEVASVFDEALSRWGEAVSRDGSLAAVSFSSDAERSAFSARVRLTGVDAADLVEFGADAEPAAKSEWLAVGHEDAQPIAWLRSAGRSAVTPLRPIERPAFTRHEILSQSESGLHFVRERKSGILRQLTGDELLDFSDPPPCAECGEQFGCEHFNCAGEPLLTEIEIDQAVPPQWIAFARESGLSREDIARLASVREQEGEYQLSPGAESDMRMLELVLLLNESR